MKCDTGGDGATTRASRMKKGENKKHASHPLAEYDRPDGHTCDQLMQEINVLTLEGKLFCYNPRDAKKKSVPITFDELRDNTVTIIPHPHYGQPSTLAYQILQAVFVKMASTALPHPTAVTFTMRELTRCIGRQWSGKKGTEEIYNALMQMQWMQIKCSLLNKKTKQWELSSFSLIPWAGFAIKQEDGSLASCLIELSPHIVASLNARHIAYMNWDRMRTLDVIGMVVYKRVYYHLCNNWNPHRGVKRDELYFHKGYDDMCAEWCGVRPERYVSDIKRRHIGARLDDLVRVGLIRSYDIKKKRDGRYKIVFWPADGFFEDYDEYYVKRKRRQPTQAQQMVDGIQQAIEAVAYFHQRLGHTHNQFQEKETGYASHLLQTLTAPELRDLIDYAVARAGETRFDPQWFNAITTYVEPWKLDQERRRARQARRDEIAACPHCDATGMLQVKTPTGAFAATECPHDSDQIAAFEERSQLRRV